MNRPPSYWKDREVDARLPGWPPIPDEVSPHLYINGAAWTIPPRGGVTPVFVDGVVEIHGESAPWNSLVEVVIKGAPVKEDGPTCPTCGLALEASITISDSTIEWVKAILTLAAMLLRSRYALNDADLSELLCIKDGVPGWITELLYWCANG